MQDGDFNNRRRERDRDPRFIAGCGGMQVDETDCNPLSHASAVGPRLGNADKGQLLMSTTALARAAAGDRVGACERVILTPS